MAKKRKKHPGIAAECSILTKFIHPRVDVDASAPRSRVILIDRQQKKVNNKQQVCFTFRIVNDANNHVHYAVHTHFRIEREGPRSDFFDPPEREPEDEGFKEPRTKWKNSKAKDILFDLLAEGKVPLLKDDTSMSVEDIYGLHEELMKYSFEKFEKRLNDLRQYMIESNTRAEDDEEAFATYVRNHEVSTKSHKGYAQWQGSTAQELLWDDIEAYMADKEATPSSLWQSRDEYKNEWQLNVFRSKLEQEIRTLKYLRTMKAKKLNYRAS